MLRNEEALWESEDIWKFKPKNNLIYVENTSKKKVFGITSDGEVILEDLVENKAEQLWRKGEPNAEGKVIYIKFVQGGIFSSAITQLILNI